MHVRRGQTCLGLTGEQSPVSVLEAEWRRDVQRHLAEGAERIVEQARRHQPAADRGPAADELARNGFVRRGDLVLFDGRPPLLGYVLPTHYNHVLGRQSRGDLALAAPLQLPPQLTPPRLLQRAAGGRWEPYQPPHGLCLGGGLPQDRPQTPGLTLAAYLRWAALRLAANGKFHSSDANSSFAYDD
jgi:hypothetical protein